MRRTLGVALTVVGAALLLFVGSAYARGALERDRVRAEWERLEARRALLAVDARLGVSAEREYGRGTPVARLLIPSLGLDEIVVEGVGERELMSGPGHVPGTPLPGARGNAIVSAHRDRHFHRLDGLRVGDVITTEAGERTVTWRVRTVRVMARAAAVVPPADAPTLTLTTCWPVRYLGPAPDRLIVTATP